ncbi:MAG: hypothetical protein IMZ71_03985, partial [Chloroflexi bacterium]|nr:hypothetical protein [Chloroflexota bacterium]
MTIWNTGSMHVICAASRDLMHWGEPWAFAWNSVYRNETPNLSSDGRGGVWVTWFTNRFSLGTYGYPFRLWASGSVDGRQWSPPRLVSGKGNDWWPAQMARGADGRWRIVLPNRWIGSAATIPDIRDFSTMDIDRSECADIVYPHVVADPQGDLHMVFDGCTSAGDLRREELEDRRFLSM